MTRAAALLLAASLLLALALTACTHDDRRPTSAPRLIAPAHQYAPPPPAPIADERDPLVGYRVRGHASRPAVVRASRNASRSRPRVTSSPRADGSVWWRLALCESGGNPRAVGEHGRFFGAFQFSLATWHGIGMAGDPRDYPYEVQLAAARRLQARSGWGQWPACSRKIRVR